MLACVKSQELKRVLWYHNTYEPPKQKSTQTINIMQHIVSTLLLVETLAILVFSLVFGMGLLRLRDFLFGEDGSSGNHHIDFKKKIEEEEQANLDEILRDRGHRSLDTDLMKIYQHEERLHREQ